MKRNAGFTLIELVIVIIVLGILAATAVPKFMNLQDDAKNSALKGVEAALHSAANITYSKAAIDGVERSPGSSAAEITTTYGYPDGQGSGIVSAVESSGIENDSTINNTFDSKVTFFLAGANTKGCSLVYKPATDNEVYQIWYTGVSGAASSSTPTCGG